MAKFDNHQHPSPTISLHTFPYVHTAEDHTETILHEGPWHQTGTPKEI